MTKVTQVKNNGRRTVQRSCGGGKGLADDGDTGTDAGIESGKG